MSFPLQSSWSVTLASSPSFRPAYDRLRAYVALRNGQLSAIDLADGQIAWSVAVATSEAPAAGDGLVFVGADGMIEGRSTDDGQVRWRVPVEGRLSAPLLWDTGWLLAGTDQGEVLAMRATDGEILWRRSLGSVMRNVPAPADDRLYLSLEDGRLMALALQTGEPVWTRRLREPSNEILALDDRLFLGSEDNYFYCLALKDGAVRWRWRTGADIVGAPVVDLSRVYFVSLDNVVRALDRGNGALKWQRPMPIRPSSGPLRIGDTLLVPGIAAELRAYQTRDGVPAGEFAAKSPQGEALQFAAPPSVVEAPTTSIIILTRDGLLQALASSSSGTR